MQPAPLAPIRQELSEPNRPGLYASMEIHSGLIIIVPTVDREDRIRLFELALDAAEQQDSLVNLLIEVHADGTVDVRDWSKGDPQSTG